MSLQDEIAQVRTEALAAFQSAGDANALEAARIKYIGSNGAVKAFMKRLGEVPKDQKPAAGQALNALKDELTNAHEAAKGAKASAAPKSAVAFDYSEPLAPERVHAAGKLHPLTRTVNELRDLLRALGFEVVEGPEVEDERHNFDDLNIPADHPARDSFDTFFLNKDALLRSQTSTVQVRVMESRRPPVRVIAPGRVYRPDIIDATHHSTFHQIEGLYVDKGVTMADLKGTLQLFVNGLFGEGTRIRFRPSFFPFTEPSAELDCSCPACGGDGCNVCKDSGWVELGGCGMVDPAVFEAINKARGDHAYDPDVWSGFAFGFGIERLAMRRHGITDIRRFLENDLRFLRQI
ncbi:MAG: phenylalanine--tRNA ligase subunit alpha [Planctomycetota bacterium]|nr:phenylalanine--tRNA ligase subunit alpha [Planctomycetota bacterium]